MSDGRWTFFLCKTHIERAFRNGIDGRRAMTVFEFGEPCDTTGCKERAEEVWFPFYEADMYFVNKDEKEALEKEGEENGFTRPE